VVIPWRDATIYDDTYNSNPYALVRTLELMTQAEVEGRRIAVIGDMLELGEKELDFHRDAGKSIPRSIDVVVGVGPRSRALLEGARAAGFKQETLHHYPDAQSAGAFLIDFIRPGDLVLLKASRGIGLDKIVTMLQKEDGR
jgi:UDP-N-acetylmuramoyl-tripeptide--D-alanyl-D-alanine ligase